MTILSYGEALIDLLESPEKPGFFCAQSGGAPANVAVGIAKLGGRSHFLGGFGQDSFSEQLLGDLADHGVEVAAARHSKNTALAIVSLAQDGERSFAFHRHQTADLAVSNDAILNAQAYQPNVLHYCSNMLTTDGSLSWHNKVLSAFACRRSFDVNLRLPLWDAESLAQQRTLNAIEGAHLVKLSSEEQAALGISEASLLSRSHSQTYLLTDGAGPIYIYHQGQRGEVVPPAAKVIDTTAGGDGFMSGVLYWVDQHGWPTTLADWQSACQLGAKVGAWTVSHYGSFQALPYQQDIAT